MDNREFRHSFDIFVANVCFVFFIFSIIIIGLLICMWILFKKINNLSQHQQNDDVPDAEDHTRDIEAEQTFKPVEIRKSPSVTARKVQNVASAQPLTVYDTPLPQNNPYEEILSVHFKNFNIKNNPLPGVSNNLHVPMTNNELYKYM